ncbi:hypothetical protein [Nonomuraea sp. CA-141351]|uniref:hypothetical protein n=1 Tax=Nonomuraea sp. CA-141351 TaxID=3239996 RepID=UPI003D8CE26E
MIGVHRIGVHRIGEGCYQRADGAVLSDADLAECRPLHRDELRDLAWLLGLLEDWLLHTSDDVRADLATFPGPSRHTIDRHTIDDLIDHLGTQAVKLHRLTR